MKNQLIPNNNIQSQNIYAKIRKDFSINKYIYLLAIPVIAYYLLFMYGPMYGVVIAFKQFNISKGILESPWVGFKYFKEFTVL